VHLPRPPLCRCCRTTSYFHPPPRVTWKPAAALAPLAGPFPRAPRLPERRPADSLPPPWHGPSIPSGPLISCSRASLTRDHSILHFLSLAQRPEPRTPPPPPSSTPATPCSPWVAHSNHPRTTTTPCGVSPHLTDTPRPLLAAEPPPEPPRRRYLLAGKFLFPSSSSLRPSSDQPSHQSSFLSSC
jgi:hypothetical protein